MKKRVNTRRGIENTSFFINNNGFVTEDRRINEGLSIGYLSTEIVLFELIKGVGLIDVLLCIFYIMIDKVLNKMGCRN